MTTKSEPLTADTITAKDVQCPRCGMEPRRSCRSIVYGGKGPMTRSHSERVRAARAHCAEILNPRETSL